MPKSKIGYFWSIIDSSLTGISEMAETPLSRGYVFNISDFNQIRYHTAIYICMTITFCQYNHGVLCWLFEPRDTLLYVFIYSTDTQSRPLRGSTGAFFPGPQPERGPMKGPLNTCLKDRYTLIEQSQCSSEEQCSKLINKEIWLVRGSYCHCQYVMNFFFFVFHLQLE